MLIKRTAVLLLVLVLILSGCADPGIYESAEGSFPVRVDEKQILVERSPANNETVSLINRELETFLTNYSYGKGLLVADSRTRDIAASVSVKLSWKSIKECSGYTVIYATKQDFSDAVSRKVTQPELELTDLFVATTYYWQVVTHTASDDHYSTVFAFHTAQTPRWLSVDGVYNTRDLGGYLTEDGAYRVRQGMVYRGSRLDEITAAGKERLLNVYKVKTDFDLRDSSDSGFTGLASPVGDAVRYINIGGVGYISSITDKADSMLQELLVYTQGENYPVYTHCSAGRDRCGTLMFHLGALLGLSKETLLADYEMTYLSARSYAFGDQKGHNLMMTFLDAFERIPGDTYKEKAENFWLQNGMTQEQIQTLRDILLEKVN